MDRSVKATFDSYPESARNILLKIRTAVFELSSEEHVGQITETLKWGDPSYLAKHGSTVRLGWNAKYPEYVSVYFNCNTMLVETFKEIYPDTFNYVANREIRLLLSETIPNSALKSCILMSLRYHKINQLPVLGA